MIFLVIILQKDRKYLKCKDLRLLNFLRPAV